MKGKFQKFLVASSFIALLSGFNLVNYAFADSEVVNNESKEVKEVLEQKEILKQSVNIDKYDLVRKSELGVKKGYDKDDPKPDWAPGDSFGSPKGTNNISFTAFAPGDIIVVHDGSPPWGYYRHAAVWDGTYYTGSLDSYAFIEANVENQPGDGQSNVHYSTARKFRNYDQAVGLYVYTLEQQFRTLARNYIRNQLGEPYKFVGSYKSDDSTWYCSKLAWKAYYEMGNRDLDYDGGLYVYPDDIYQDGDTKIFATGS
ncbi:hypothetical conserved protein [Geobacillus kaustophilus HTA426]|uniref:Hypothetical conserved protein n=1 Tax=Geobacillus kaustophilus (strain HTA426) TaxID=235909 RepID=Q5KVE8_GEOKA|nr:YiiX/YebB-like N1pC/P60 family cysteine hydrolase [Geobacillus kaustophilus]BAD77338.1 hypothetical conserved protein [Geobacillus kaustophilus HTA426]